MAALEVAADVLVTNVAELELRLRARLGKRGAIEGDDLRDVGVRFEMSQHGPAQAARGTGHRDAQGLRQDATRPGRPWRRRARSRWP